MGLFRRDKDESSEKDKGKSKEKAKDKKDKAKSKDATPSLEIPSADDSPSDSRMSRDTYSVHTQTSISESHESLPLDASSSNPQLDVTPAGNESVNGIKRLLRKGSSSKFSLSSRLGKDSSLFKKGPGSATNSDKNMSIDQRSSIGDLDELHEDDTDHGSRKEELGKSYDSMTSSPGLGPSRSKEMMTGAKERLPSWSGRMGFGMKKKQAQTPSKEKESMDFDRVDKTEE